jgi:cell division protein FtsI/penicillin-binding protein 2
MEIEDPKLAVIVVIDEPQGNNFGGVVAAPAFKGIVEKVLPYLTSDAWGVRVHGSPGPKS